MTLGKYKLLKKVFSPHKSSTNYIQGPNTSWKFLSIIYLFFLMQILSFDLKININNIFLDSTKKRYKKFLFKFNSCVHFFNFN